MKKYLFIILAAACMTGCMDWTSQYTPSVTVSAFFTASGDTLVGHITDESHDYYTLDSICLGDTAFFMIYNQSFANNLISSSVTWDTTRLKMWTVMSDDFSKILLPTSNIEALRFDYVSGYNQTRIPVYMLPIKSGNTKLHFTVTSDSDYAESDGTIEIIVK